MDQQPVFDLSKRLAGEIHKVIVGQDEAIELLLICLLADGHILLEGVPGTGKTLLARTFAAALSLDFGRIQFTPDLMPSDILGTNLFNFQSSEFVLTRGPLFTQLLLADEINRTPPKTQAALLEAMQERSVTIDGKTHALGSGFMVVATQNPIEHEGTYPLPEAELDRFLFKVTIEYPSRDEERSIVLQHGASGAMPSPIQLGVAAVATMAELDTLRASVRTVRIAPDVVDYIVDVVRATREHPSLQYGASPRAAAMIACAARAAAAIAGREFVLPDDIKRVAVPGLGHRVVLAPAAQIDGLSAGEILQQILERVAAPR